MKKGIVVALVALVALGAVAVAISALPSSARATVDHPCTNIPQPTGAVYTHPIPPTNPSPVDPIVAVPSPGGGSFAELVTSGGVTTRQKFVPRGADYVRLTTVAKGPNIVCTISTFNVGTGLDAYNPHRAAQVLATMEEYGYNVIRVGFNSAESGQASGGLNPAYWANVANFINLARTYNIRVSMVLMPLPIQDLPKPSTVPLPTADQTRNGNLYYLEPVYLAAEENYVRDLIGILETEHANMSDIFSYELEGETYFKTNLWPLDMTSGIVSTSAGSFNMASATSREAMIDANTLYWENQLTAVIHSLLPGSLVALGFTQGLAKFPEGRIGRAQSSLSSSSLVDYVDFHLYPIFGPIQSQISSIGVAADTVTKPIIMGEFGEYGSEAPNASVAANALAAWERQSCDLFGFRFSGWITWTWDTEPWEQQPAIYTMTNGHYAIAKAIAPQSMDPSMSNCQ